MVGYIVGIVFGSIIIVASMIALAIKFFKTKSSKKIIEELGRTSEELINKDIAAWAKITKNRFVPAALYKYSENMFFEVDSILITDKALIVVEIKSIKGSIVGDANEDSWTKVMGENRFALTNPIRQNDKHISHIEKMTNIKAPTISLIIYSNRASGLNIKNVPSHVAVIRHAELFETLDSINKSLPAKISEEERKTIEKSLRKFITSSKEDIKKFKEIFSGGK